MKTVTENNKGSTSGRKKVKGEPKLYEAMFLVDSAEAATDWDGVAGAIKSILDKEGAEIVSLKKWDERKLAYNIKGKGKGTYILCYFRAEGSKLRNIERDIQLSERIMRALILCSEQRPEDIEAVPVSQSAGESKTQRQVSEEPETKDEEQKQIEQPEAEDLEQAK